MGKFKNDTADRHENRQGFLLTVTTKGIKNKSGVQPPLKKTGRNLKSLMSRNN
jgi:hypothetical protein